MSDTIDAPPMRVLVTLIHHGVEERVSPALKTVGTVCEAVAPFGEIQTFHVWHQPDVSRIRVKNVVSRKVRQWRLERRWASYLGVGRRWILSTGLLAVRLAQLTQPRIRRSEQRMAFIELVLSAKHELAWRHAYEVDADLLIVLEDDARANEHSTDRMRRLLGLAVEDGHLADTYIDLAGGLSQQELRLGSLTRTRGDGVVSLTRAATNTACGYAMGRAVISRIAGMTMYDPASTRIPADWLLNRFFMDVAAAEGGSTIHCLHSDPHALQHGSFTGDVTSSIRS